MRILIHPSSFHCLNLGDVAMMQVTVRRFRRFWPDAEIHVLNDSPELLELYCHDFSVFNGVDGSITKLTGSRSFARVPDWRW